MKFLRFFLGLVCFLASLLAVCRAPEIHLWYVAIGASEWGHVLALVSLLPWWPGWKKSRLGIAGVCLGSCAAMLSLSPIMGATQLAEILPGQLSSEFGSIASRSGPGAPARSTPFSIRDLLAGVYSPSVPVTTLSFETADHASLTMDVYHRTGVVHAPGVIVVHGGSWKSGNRRELPELNRYLAARGYVVASLDYRFAPEAIFPTQIEEVEAAIAALKTHAAEIGLDPQRLVLLGRSAGGQIALETAYTAHDPAIRGAIDFYAPLDLAWGYLHPCSPLIMDSKLVLRTYLGATPDENPDVYAVASPTELIDAHTPPTLILHGSLDVLVAPHHSEVLAQGLQAAHRPSVYIRLPWATHGCDANFSGPSGQITTYAIERFLASVTQ